MNTNGKYGPEDLESLLMEKDFASLYPEEREYVLQHMSDEEEYGEMRGILLSISQDSDEAEMMSAPPSLKQNLMDQHKAYHKKPSFTIWLNSVFAMFRIPEHIGKPALQFASLIAVVIIAWWLIPGTGKQEMAVHTEAVQEVPSEMKVAEKTAANGLEQEEEIEVVQKPDATEDTKEKVNEELTVPSETYEYEVVEKPSPAKVQTTSREDVADIIQEDSFVQPQSTSLDVTSSDDYIMESLSEIVVTEESSNSKKKELASRAEAAPTIMSSDKRKDMASTLPSTKVDPDLISLLYTTW